MRRRKAISRKKRQPAPRSADDFLRRPKAFQELWTRGLRAVWLMKEREKSLPDASTEAGVGSRFVRRWMSAALWKNAGGRYAAKLTSRLFRLLKLPSADGPSIIEIATRDSREATVISRYWQLLGIYTRTGDASVFRKLRRKTVRDADGKRVPLVFDPEILDLLAHAGLLSFETIYAQSA